MWWHKGQSMKQRAGYAENKDQSGRQNVVCGIQEWLKKKKAITGLKCEQYKHCKQDMQVARV